MTKEDTQYIAGYAEGLTHGDNYCFTIDDVEKKKGSMVLVLNPNNDSKLENDIAEICDKLQKHLDQHFLTKKMEMFFSLEILIKETAR